MTLEKIRSWYSLKPDARFLMAVAEIDRFFGLKSTQPPEVIYKEDHWEIVLAGMRSAQIPLYPDYADLQDLLVQHAAFRMSEQKFTVATDIPEKKGLIEALFQSAVPLKALQEIDSAWKVKTSGYLLSQAASSTALLAFELSDVAGIGTPVYARALAYLALAKVVTQAPQNEAESLLAFSLGYSQHAQKVATLLPSDHPIRLYVLRKDAALRRLSAEKAGSGLVRYLFIQRLANLKKGNEWSENARALFPDFDPALPLMKSGIDTGEFEHKREFGSRISYTVLVELSELVGKRSDPASKVADQIAALDSLLPAIRSDGRFADAELLRNYYSSYFYSGLTVQGLFCLDSLSSVEATNEFVAALGTPKGEVGKEFSRWFTHLAAFKSGKQKWTAFLPDINGLPHLGARLVRRTMTELLDAIPYQHPDTLTSMRRFAERLDTRPQHRIWFAHDMYYELADLRVVEDLHSSFIRCCKDSDQEAFVWYSKFTGQLEGVLESEEIDEEAKVDILYYMTKDQDQSFDQITAAYKKLYSQYPDNFYVSRHYAGYLADADRVDEAESVLRRWLRDHSWQEDGFDYIHTSVQLAEILREHGRFEDGWNAVEPVISSWQQGALGEAALLLDRLGRKKEAQEMGKRVLERYPHSAWSIGVGLQMHWENGEYKEAAEALKKYRYPITDRDWCFTIGKQYAEVFVVKPNHQGIQALTAIAGVPEYGEDLTCFARRVEERNKPDLAFDIVQFLNRRGMANIRDLVVAYGFMSDETDKARAVEWLRKELPESKHDAFALFAFAGGSFDLLWDVVTPNKKIRYPEYVWLMRAASSAKIGPQDPHRKELIEYYSSNDPTFVRYYSAAGRRQHLLIGQFLMDLIPLERLLQESTDNRSLCEYAYYIGLKAESGGQYASACEWYRLAVETRITDDTSYAWAFDTLQSWRVAGRNLDYAARKKLGLVLF